MNILITGGAGFIGSNLVRYILENTSSKVTNFDKLTYAGNLESLVDVESNPNYSFVQGDICDAQAVEQAFEKTKPDAVMHLAAESHVDRSIDGPDQFMQTNVLGTFNLLQAARAYCSQLSADKSKEFRFLHVSTDEVYGSLDFQDPAFHEQTPYDPHSPYSASKAASDHLARAWHSTYHLPVLVTNCSNNYGPYQFPEKLVPVVIMKAIRGEKIPVYGKGENVRDWLYVEDHAAALMRVLTDGKIGETYNIGGNNEKSNLQLVKELCGLLDELYPVSQNEVIQSSGSSIKNYSELISFVTDRPGHDLRYAINANKIASELSWQPEENSASGFKKTVQWYLDNSEWCQRCLSGEYKLQRQGAVADRPSKPE